MLRSQLPRDLARDALLATSETCAAGLAQKVHATDSLLCLKNTTVADHIRDMDVPAG
jgi:hypothetical protein